MIHQFRSNQLSSRVVLDGANIQEFVVRVYAILKSGFAHLHVQNHVEASETKNPNELPRQFLDDQCPVDVRALSIFYRFSEQKWDEMDI